MTIESLTEPSSLGPPRASPDFATSRSVLALGGQRDYPVPGRRAEAAVPSPVARTTAGTDRRR
jgi:hypothetical protein